MNKKGFTLVEILVVIAIIGFISGIGVISYRTFFKTGEEKYYENIENNMLLAGNDYFTDHRDLVPTGNEFNYVNLLDLIENKYLEPIKDTDGNWCIDGKVYIYKEDNKYKYEACLDNCGGHSSTGKYCDGTASSNVINIDAYVVGTNEKYDATKPYNSVKYLQKNQKIKVTFTMDNEKAAYYEAVNTTVSGVSYHCTKNSSGLCDITVDKSGTYKVTAYDSSDSSTRKVIASNQYFSVRITTAGPQFSITGVDKNVISLANSGCGNQTPKIAVKYTVVKSNINEEYKNVEYKINRYKLNTVESAGTYKETTGNNRLIINETLPSGKYRLYVRVTNFADEQTEEYKDFDISYFLNVTYSDGDYNGLDSMYDGMDPEHFEVVADQQYDYLGSKYSANRPLPQYKVAYTKRLEIRWHLKTEEFSEARRIFGTSTVDKNCTYGIEGLMAIPVKVPDWKEYCTNPTYDGTSKALTKNYDHVKFLNKGTDNLAYQTDAGIYDIEAKIDAPYYIWEGLWHFDNLPLQCEIKRANIDFPSCASKVYNGNNQTLFTLHTTGYINSVISGTDAGTYNGDLTPDKNHKWTDTGAITARTLDCKIERANIDFPSCASKVYNGSNQTLFTSHSTGYINSAITGIDAGKHTGDLTPDKNHKWADTGAITARALDCEIERANIDFPSCASKVYNGSNQTLFTSHSTGYINSEITGIDAGKHTGDLTPDKNHKWSDTGAITARKLSCEIERAKVDFPTCGSIDYDESEHTLFDAHSSGVGYTNKAIKGTDAGKHTGDLTPDKNHKWSDTDGITARTLTCIINKINSTCPTTSAYSGKYDGNSHSIGVSGGKGGTIKYSTNNKTWSTSNPTRKNSGSQTTYVMVSGDKNHFDNTSCTARTITITIDCSAGYYLKKGNETCTICPKGSYCGGKSNMTKSDSGNQGIDSCPSSNSSSAKGSTKIQDCYRSGKKEVCNSRVVQDNGRRSGCNPNPNGTTMSGGWYYGNYKGDSEHGDASYEFTGWKCLEGGFVCGNGINLPTTGYCYYLRHNNCYGSAWSTKSGSYSELASKHCDCRIETGIGKENCKVYYGQTDDDCIS